MPTRKTSPSYVKILVLAVLFHSCSEPDKISSLESRRANLADLESLLPQMLDKPVSEISAKLDIDPQELYFINEPPSVNRGFRFKFNEKVTISIMTGRTVSVLLNEQERPDSIEELKKMDFENMQDLKAMGIEWSTDSHVYYIGTGFVWPIPGYNSDPQYRYQLQKIKPVY